MMRKQGMMMGPMKGHLAPNSSPFKPTINKLSSQYLIQDHMSSHYNKLSTMKPAIDNRPPKSMTTSVKKRDQMKREAMAKQMKLFDFEKNMKHGSPYKQCADQHSIDTHRSFSVTVSKHNYDEVRPQTSSSLHSTRLSTHSRSLSGTYSPESSLRSSREGTQYADILNKTYGGDYLDRHEERFKNVDTPFTPRLKKRSGKSFLSNSKHYAPPLVLHKETKRKVASKPDPQKTEPEIAYHKPTYSPVINTGHTTSSDDDHHEWTEDQSEILKRLTLDNSLSMSEHKTLQKSENHDTFRPQTKMRNPFFGTSSLGRSFTSGPRYDNQYETKYRIQTEDDELKYLEFINEVTNDILTRGIYSDRVLTKVMERHLEENRGKLDEGRMRLMLYKLQEDLGVASNLSFSNRHTAQSEKKRSHSATDPMNTSHSSRAPAQGRKRSPRKMTARPRVAASSGTSRSEASDGGRVKSGRKGILKNPGSRSSGSEQDVRSNISSGEDEEKRKLGGRTFVPGVIGNGNSDPETTLKEVAVADEALVRASPKAVSVPQNSQPAVDSVSSAGSLRDFGCEEVRKSAEVKRAAKMSNVDSSSEHENAVMTNSIKSVSKETIDSTIRNAAEEVGDSEDDF